MAISNEIYKYFSKYVFEHTGIEYQEHDFYRLDSRINTLISHYKLQDADDLYKKCKLGIDKQMHDFMVDLFTNNETYFMRDLKPFKALAKGVIPSLMEENKGLVSLNLWSCACSTGQEVYSIKIALDSFGDSTTMPRISIDASDISDEALRKAKLGEYTGLEVQRGLPAPFLLKYLEKKANSEVWSIKSDLRSSINFYKFNLLLGNYPLPKYHIIFCRNVLIYQNQANKQKILSQLADVLKPGGILVLGAGESLIGMKLPFKHVEIEGAWFYKKSS